MIIISLLSMISSWYLWIENDVLTYMALALSLISISISLDTPNYKEDFEELKQIIKIHRKKNNTLKMKKKKH